LGCCAVVGIKRNYVEPVALRSTKSPPTCLGTMTVRPSARGKKTTGSAGNGMMMNVVFFVTQLISVLEK